MPFFAAVAAVSLAGASPVLVEKPCADPRLARIARCGTVSVAEDRQQPKRRTIQLNVIVMPATAKSALPPLFDIDGGPGLPSTKNVAFYATAGAAYRTDRDVVMVDQRGTGQSNALHCPAFSKPEAAYQPIYPAAQVRTCRKVLEQSADLTKYGTADVVADLDAVRAALGYERIDLFGLSYGTTVALRYLATHPKRVRAAVLMGVAPASATPPKGHALAGDRALKRLFGRCLGEPACAAAFNPGQDIDRARARLETIANAPPTEVFFEKLRSLMYLPTGSRQVPLILNRAGAGDLSPFFAATRPRDLSLYADGMHLSVICSEGMALMDVAAARRAARATPFGDYRLRQQQQACAEWTRAQVPDNHLLPVQSDAPVLLISGELDPVTPPELADEAARTLPNARHLVIPASGHLFDGMSGVETCLDPLILDFLRTGSVRTLKADCISSMKPPPFALTVEPAQLRQ
jgi:pimeloyl-ACP methyl ester carboxylesterase